MVVALVAALALPAAAVAGTTYPPAGSPGKGEGKRKAKGETLRVCKKGCRFRTISRALRYADGADTIRRERGVYRGTLLPLRPALRRPEDHRRPQAAPQGPGFDGKRLKGRRAQNAIFILRLQPSAGRRLPRAQLQGQRLLRGERQRLHLHQPDRGEDRRVWHLRVQLQGRHDVALGGVPRERQGHSTSARRRLRRGPSGPS